MSLKARVIWKYILTVNYKKNEEHLLMQKELEAVRSIRKALSNYLPAEVTETLIGRLIATKTNTDFIDSINSVYGR